MLIKMKESKGFTLVELMIVVAIIGILAAVAVPFYQRYVQKAKLTSLVFPALHSVETNVAAYFAVSNTFANSIDPFTADADFSCIDQTQLTFDRTNGLFIAISSANCPELEQLNTKTFRAVPAVTRGKITSWRITGSLADELGLTSR
ncbi:MAG: type IV pilin protein [Syntrophobacteraceae bacterium]